MFALAAAGAPFTWSIVAAAFEGTRTKLACERRYSELVGTPISGNSENTGSSTATSGHASSGASGSLVTVNSSSPGSSSTSNSNNDEDVVFVKTERTSQ